jgi:hypothetical protein
LESHIDEAHWGRMLMQRNRSFTKHETYFNIHQMFVLAGTDIMQRLIANPIEDEPLYQEISELRAYYNRELYKTSKRYKDQTGTYYEYITSAWKTVQGYRRSQVNDDLIDLLTEKETK